MQWSRFLPRVLIRVVLGDKEMEDFIYFLISVSNPPKGKQIPNFQTIAFFFSREDCEMSVAQLAYRKNVPYRYLVIEKASPGLRFQSELLAWYEAGIDGVYRSRNTPTDIYLGVDSYLKLRLMLKPQWQTFYRNQCKSQ